MPTAPPLPPAPPDAGAAAPADPHASAPEAARAPEDAERLRRERDFYRHLVRLGAEEDLERLLEAALSLVVELTRARRGYIEISAETAGAPPHFWMAHGLYDADVEEVRAAFSSGVIAEALASGRTVALESAQKDPRFWARGSVLRNRTEAVLCAPVGGAPPLGVVYLQDREGGGPFGEDDRALVEAFALHLATLADRLLTRRRARDAEDPTASSRAALALPGLVGRSRALARVLEQLRLVAPLEVSVLLTGPTGTGKTQLARLIHDNSPRRAGPFVALNCAALPEHLVESELFGSVAGAHSTAHRKMEGKVAAAEGGTLFLDEVGDLHPLAQAKLLQLLQSGEYYPLGQARPERADVRVLAATNADLREAVARRAFREDLLYRLEVLPVRVPSLAERTEDVAELAAHFCARACEAHRLARLRLSVGALRALEAAEWPGNVRELGHRVQAAVIRAAGEGVLQVERRHLFPEEAGAAGAASAPEPAPTFQQATRDFQEALLRRTLEDTGWNITEAAARLDLSRSHIYNLIAAFGLERRPAGGAPPGPGGRAG